MEPTANQDVMATPEPSAPTNKKGNSGLKIATIVCAILAVAGLGFGIYELLQANSAKQQISDLKIEITKEDGKTIAVADLDESIVITALDEEQSTPWPEDIPREEYEPEILVSHIKIPKINLETSAAASIN